MLTKRAGVQSNATCASEYSWMYNRQNISPCWLAAAVTGPCQQGDFNVAPLQADHHYDPPLKANATATRCMCSWAAYNLYSACTMCQEQPGSTLTWPAYKQDCPSDFLSNDTYWPADITILGSNTLPFYAGTNPSQWTDQRFDVQQARNITNQQHADLTGRPLTSNDSPTTTKSKAPVGAIAGGVVGGVAVLILAAVAFWFIRRKRGAPRRTGGVQELDPGYQRHSFSEVVPNKPVLSNSVSYTGSTYPTTTSFQTHPVSPTVYTHNESVHSFSQFGSVSAYTTPHSPPPHERYASPAPTMQTTYPTVAPEDHIQPFVLPTPVHSHSHSYSRSQSGSEPPVSPRKGDRVVLNREDESADEGYPFPNVAATTSVNGATAAAPPAYTQYPAPSEASSHNVATARRELHGHGHRPYPPEKGARSQDSTLSSTTSTSPWTSFGSGEGIVNASAGSSHAPFGMAPAQVPGEFGQIQHNVTMGQRPQRRSVAGGQEEEERVEVA